MTERDEKPTIKEIQTAVAHMSILKFFPPSDIAVQADMHMVDQMVSQQLHFVRFIKKRLTCRPALSRWPACWYDVVTSTLLTRNLTAAARTGIVPLGHG